MTPNRPSSETSLDFLRQVLARDTEVRDDIVARVDAHRFVDILGRRSTATRVRRIVEAAETASAGPSFPDAAAQAAVLFDIRPSLLVRDESFELPASPVWRDRLIEAEAAIRRAIPSVGRVDLKDHPHPRIAEMAHIGAAWMISDTVAVTNRHVARTFGLGSGQEFRFWSDGMSVRIDFRDDPRHDMPRDFAVTRILEIVEDADADIAFLQFEPNPDLPQPVVLDDHCENEFIVAIGYPSWDPQIPPEMVRHVLDGVYDAKRIAPGRIIDAGDESTFRYDASTLKGSSGSVVLSLETGNAVGLHMGGVFNAESTAVTSARLKSRLHALSLSVAVPTVPDAAELERPDALAVSEPTSPGGYDAGFLGPDHPLPIPGLDRCSDNGGAASALAYNHFSIVLDGARRMPISAACNIDGLRLKRIPRPAGFALDGRLAACQQWDDSLYRHNPYDRGQVIGRSCPVWGDRETAGRANDDTFFLTNIVPQHTQLNRTIWNGLEDHFLDNGGPRDARLSVFSGCIFDEDDPQYRGARIPRQFWKIVAFVAGTDHPELRACGFLLDQSHLVRDIQDSFAFGAPKTYQLPIARIGARTSLDLRCLQAADTLTAGDHAVARPIAHFSEVAT